MRPWVLGCGDDMVLNKENWNFIFGLPSKKNICVVGGAAVDESSAHLDFEIALGVL